MALFGGESILHIYWRTFILLLSRYRFRSKDTARAYQECIVDTILGAVLAYIFSFCQIK